MIAAGREITLNVLAFIHSCENMVLAPFHLRTISTSHSNMYQIEAHSTVLFIATALERRALPRTKSLSRPLAQNFAIYARRKPARAKAERWCYMEN